MHLFFFGLKILNYSTLVLSGLEKIHHQVQTIPTSISWMSNQSFPSSVFSFAKKMNQFATYKSFLAHNKS